MKKQVLIQISNDYRSCNNQIFDPEKDKNWSYFKALKDVFAQHIIELNTFDQGDPESAGLLIFFDLPYPWDRKNRHLIKKHGHKSFLFCFEPPIVNPFNYMKRNHRFFKRVYTWNDAWVDGVKYFKLFWPQSLFEYSRQKNAVEFNEKKFLLLINGNKLPFLPFRFLSSIGKELYSERIRSIEYFEKNIPDKFDLYGRGWNKKKKFNIKEAVFGYKKYSTYRGEVDNKINLLAGYKFCMCFENITNVDGYFTEKVFDCFKAGCVPVYWGADNVKDYLPEDSFIDYRKFKNYSSLLAFLEKISETEYSKYLQAADKLLADTSFQKTWFENGFAERTCMDVLSVL